MIRSMVVEISQFLSRGRDIASVHNGENAPSFAGSYLFVANKSLFVFHIYDFERKNASNIRKQ